MTHIIKTPEFYADAIVDGRKKFEVRLNDRGYNAGDTVCFKAIYFDGCISSSHPVNNRVYKITYVHSGFGMEDNYVVFGIEEVSE